MGVRSKSWLSGLRRSQFRMLAAALAVTGSSMAGCDQVESMVDDVKNQVSEATDDSAPTTGMSTTDAAATTPAVITPQPATPTGPTPEEIVAQFKGLRPDQISDGSLAQLASSPDAAAAITEIDMTGSQVSGTGLGYLAAMPNLQSVSVSGPKISADALASLGKAQSLRSVNLANSIADDRVVSELSRIPHLQTLNLNGTPVTSGSATGLGSMRELTDLSLFGTSVDDQIAGALAVMPLRSLNLAKTRITNATLPAILKIETLETLNLAFCGVTGDGFKGFNRSNIRSLNLGETQFGIAGFKAIRGMSSLEELYVYGTGLVEHKDVIVFKTFPKLRILNAGRNAVTNAGMEAFFKGHKTLVELHLQHNKGITDQGLAALIGVKTLKVLDVGSTSCGAAGAQALKQKLPECQIITSNGTF